MIAYLDYVTASAVELGADKRTARKELENVIEFEQELSKVRFEYFPFVLRFYARERGFLKSRLRPRTAEISTVSRQIILFR